MAAKHNIKYAVGSIEELVAIDEIDAVSICTWNNAHAKAAIAAANAGKHVLCEKPMAMTVAEAEEMKEAAEKNNIIFMMGFTNRFRSDSKVIKEMADSGKLGEIYYARTGWFRRRGTPLGWFTDLSKSGGGPVIDIGVHVIDLTWYFMGKPRPVALQLPPMTRSAITSLGVLAAGKPWIRTIIFDTETCRWLSNLKTAQL